ncbi:hypothetical protein [Phaeovulum sp.]|uniref:hypothetical protein n=1 Tax=Phaeovulum sp. TaxID=2934796 RepID=UPI0027321E68|nr:hypothetical protein [Phaeovulum sp.]MDP1668694.1 hypothetical protein [Phaeovulum sp.]MDZ4120408.1 hypothetical protein [Phaeovulum sp.]
MLIDTALRLAKAKEFGARTRHLIGPHGSIFRRNRKTLRKRGVPLGGLARENSAMPDSLPEAEAAALLTAESTWAELVEAPPPWRDDAQPTRRL